MSPGSLREQEAYLLGSVEAPAVVGALLAAFADPELALDRAFANEAAASVLAMANGYRLTTGGEGPGGGGRRCATSGALPGALPLCLPGTGGAARRGRGGPSPCCGLLACRLDT